MRLLILAALAAGALLAWLNVRDLIGDWRTARRALGRYGDMDWSSFDPMDDVQSTDPWQMRWNTFPQSTPRGTGDVIPQPWVNTCTSDDLAPAYTPDMPYLEAVPLAHMRRAYGGRPIGGT